jgi:hypothetical protein
MTGDAVVDVVVSFDIRFLRLLKAFWNILMMSRVRKLFLVVLLAVFSGSRITKLLLIPLAAAALAKRLSLSREAID